MESRNNSEVFLEQGSSNLKKSKEDLVKNLNVSKSSIPDWKNFDIEDIAEVKMGLDQKIFLKDVKENAKGERYIEINGRKYYEYNGKGTPKNSFYIHKRGALFLGDKIGGLSVWDGVSFRYLNDSGENFFFEQRKTRYSGGVMHLQQIYKSENVSKSGIITTFYWRGKNVQITKDIIERYLNGSISDSAKKMVEAAIKFDPDLLIYIEEMSNR